MVKRVSFLDDLYHTYKKICSLLRSYKPGGRGLDVDLLLSQHGLQDALETLCHCWVGRTAKNRNIICKDTIILITIPLWTKCSKFCWGLDFIKEKCKCMSSEEKERRIMHLLRDLHPTLLSALEGIVDQVKGRQCYMHISSLMVII